MKMVTVKNNLKQKNPLGQGRTIIPFGGTGVVDIDKVSSVLIDSGQVIIEDNQKDILAEDGKDTMSIASIIESLKENPDQLGADDFTQAGIPEVSALEKVFDAELTAAQRDEIWEAIKDLY